HGPCRPGPDPGTRQRPAAGRRSWRSPRLASASECVSTTNPRASLAGSGLELRENAVRLFQGLFAAHVKPRPRHPPCLDRDALVEPLHEAAGLVRVVAFRKV